MANGAVQLWNGKVLKDSGKVSTGEDCCCDGCGCGMCDYCSGSVPACLAITISGIANNSCSDCGDINGVWRVKLIPFSIPCQWVGYLCSSFMSICGLDRLIATLDLSGSDYILTIVLDDPASGESIIWSKNFGVVKPDCNAWSNLVLTFVSSTATCCDGNSGTLAISVAGPCTPNTVCFHNCTECTNNRAARRYQVTINGIGGDITTCWPFYPSCPNCSDLDGTYIITMEGCGAACRGHSAWFPDPCHPATQYYRIILRFLFVGPDYQAQVLIEFSPNRPCPEPSYLESYVGKVPCETLDVVMTSTYNKYCDLSSSTCHVLAL